jgi:uncharacterized coiled-coil protein SlyX
VASPRDEQEKLIASQKATIDQLSALVTDLRAMLEQMRTREAELSAKLDALLRRTFGKSSEKMPTPAKELRKERTPEVAAALAKEKRKKNQQRKGRARDRGRRACGARGAASLPSVREHEHDAGRTEGANGLRLCPRLLPTSRSPSRGAGMHLLCDGCCRRGTA